jgi:hypothetical protein
VLLKTAKGWINDQDKEEGRQREASKPKEPGDWRMVEKA